MESHAQSASAMQGTSHPDRVADAAAETSSRPSLRPCGQGHDCKQAACGEQKDEDCSTLVGVTKSAEAADTGRARKRRSGAPQQSHADASHLSHEDSAHDSDAERQSKGSTRRSRRVRSKAVSVRRAAIEWYGSRGLDLPAVYAPVGTRWDGATHIENGIGSSAASQADVQGSALSAGRQSARSTKSLQQWAAPVGVHAIDLKAEICPAYDTSGEPPSRIGGDDCDTHSVGGVSMPASAVTADSATSARKHPLLPFPRRAIDYVTWARALTGCPLRRVGSLVANH